jgi:hypothetical protein
MSFLLETALRALSGTRLAGRMLGKDMDALSEVSNALYPARAELAQERIRDVAESTAASEQLPASGDTSGSGGGEGDFAGFISEIFEWLRALG